MLSMICMIVFSFVSQKAKLCADIQALYSSTLVGLTPCHSFSKVPGHTGGFYHLVCCHRVSVHSSVSVKAVIVVLHNIADLAFFAWESLSPELLVFMWQPLAIIFYVFYCSVLFPPSFQLLWSQCVMQQTCKHHWSIHQWFYLRFSLWFCAPSWMSRPGLMWDENSGCFKRPEYAKKPSQVCWRYYLKH